MTLLNAKFSLLGIADVEAFTGRIVERSGLRLSAQDREELHVWLIEECWSLSTCYRPGRLAFAAFADGRFRLRVVDWQRARWGRTRWTFSGREYERVRPQLVPLDDSGLDRLDAALAGSRVDGDASGFAADMRALDARGCRPGRRDDQLGEEAARRSPDGNRATGLGVDSLHAVPRSEAPDVHEPRGAQPQAGSEMARPTARAEEVRRRRPLAKRRTLGPDEASASWGPL